MGNCLCFKKRPRSPIMAIENSEEVKALGNEYFKQGNYEDAIKKYSRAIEINPNISIYYSNRAMCYYRLKNYIKSFEDGQRSIEKDSCNIKGIIVCIKSKASEALKGNVENFSVALSYYKTFKAIILKQDEHNKKILKNLKSKIKSLYSNIFQESMKNKLLIYYSNKLTAPLVQQMNKFFARSPGKIELFSCPLTMVRNI